MRRASFVFALLAACALCARGQQLNVSARARFEPAAPVVDEPCAIVLELDVDRKAALDKMRVGGLPEERGDLVVYGPFENLADVTSATSGRVLKRMRLPMRFRKPVSRTVSLRVMGYVGFSRGGASFFQNFDVPVAPVRIDVRPLPERGRPAEFSGAVGRRFELRQTLDRDSVHPNDLVTATYALSFDGYCPSNACPNVESLSKEFKAYDPKEVERTGRRVVWTQTLVPRTAQATNTAHVSFSYYNPSTKRYEVTRAEPLKLTFVSTEAASTESTSVSVTDVVEAAKPSDADAATRPLVLRFAPSDASPTVATLPPGTPAKELATWNGWRRVETPRAIGWTKGRGGETQSGEKK